VASTSELEVVLAPLPAGGAVVRVAGELDLGSVSELEQVLADASPSAPLVVDLTECSFLDSSAVRVLLEAASKSEDAGGRFALVAPGGGVRRTLEIAGVDTMLTIHPTLAEAL
jgi:anti-sigma B factor antagonist